MLSQKELGKTFKCAFAILDTGPNSISLMATSVVLTFDHLFRQKHIFTSLFYN